VSEDHTGSDPADEPFRWRGALVLFGVLFLGVSDTQLIPPLLPLIADDLGVTPGQAGIAVTVYALAAATFALMAGAASDRFGRRRLMAGALVGFSLASAMTSWTGHFSTLLLARLLTGFSAGALSTIALSWAADLYPYERRGRAMGILSMAYFLAFVIGIPAGAIVAGRFGWRWVYTGIAILTVLVLAVVVRALPPETPRPSRPVLETFRAHFASRDRIAGVGAAFLTSGGLVGFITYVPAWLAGQGIGVERVGLLLMVAGMGATLASPVSGWLADRIGKKHVIVAANVLLAPAFLLAARVDWGAALFATVVVIALVAAARQAPLHALTTEFVPAESRGSYVALRNAASQLGIATITALAALRFDQDGFAAAVQIPALVTLLLIPVCLTMREPGGGRR
jgi:multidrug resistance protein